MNFLNDSSNEESKVATNKQHVTDSQTTKINSDAFILVTGDIMVAANNNTDVAFKNCAPFSTAKTEINDVFIDVFTLQCLCTI